jgi:hypothetical protein
MYLLILFLVSFLSGLAVVIPRFKRYLPITPLLLFSGAFLLGTCFLHLLPELFERYEMQVGIYLLVGYFLQLLLDYFSGGIEHGHIHVHRKRMGKFPLLVFISLCLHAFLEATPIGHFTSDEGIHEYLGGILLHKIPISIILVSLLMAYQIPMAKVIFSLFIFAAIGPVGSYLGSHLQVDEGLFKISLAIAIGIILHLSTTILLETNEEHKIRLKKIIPLLAGAGTSLLTTLLH